MAKAKTSKPKRAKGNENGNGKARAPRKPKPEKLTPEQLTDRQLQELLFAHKNKLVPLLAVEKKAKAAVSKAFKLAEQEGVSKKEIKLLIQLKDEEDGVEKAQNAQDMFKRVARWAGVADQLELFVEKETVSQRLYEDGRRAALDDLPARPPEHIIGDPKKTNIWLDGHSNGRRALNEKRAQGFKPLGEIAAGGLGLGPVAQFDPASGAAIGTEPAAAEVAH